MTVPTDPLYAQQWHFTLLGNGRGRSLLERVWNEFTGTGIHVGVYDTGIENTHPDLDGNYDRTREVSINGNKLPVQSNDAHGTAVAGIIAAERNGVGGVGIAFGASVTSVNVLEPAPTFANRLLAYAEMKRFDVVNNSWGYPSDFFTGDAPEISQIIAQYALVSQLGRNGNGTVIVQSAGNDIADANGNGLNTSRYTITVAALLDTGGAAAYSNHGASVLVSAPGGGSSDGLSPRITTTDLSGFDGNDLGDFTDTMNGTSAAAPMVAATAALMLDANPNLGWRDVQSILALTAFHTGSNFGFLGPNELFAWGFNNARNWNGGGQHFSFDYGYGNIDPFGAVRMAEAFGVMGATSQRSDNELTSSASFSPSLSLLDGSHFTTFNVASNPLTIEHMEVTLTITHPDFSSLTIFLLSPSGTFSPMATNVPVSASAGFTWVFGSEAFRGEQSIGTWTLQVIDNVTGNTGLLSQFKVDFYGGAPDGSADTYHFTDEFAEMKALNAARATLADTDGGIDWINAAAVSTGSTINLNGGTAGSIDGTAFTIAAGTEIENIIAGDGNDVLTGSGVANRLHGMRGNDTLAGGEGDDLLDGGAGSDSITGGGGNDSYIISSATDNITEVDGQGAADRARTSVSFALASGDYVEFLETTNASATTAISLKGNEFAQTIIGNAGANTLGGGTDSVIDTLIGGLGADTYVLGDGADSVLDTVGTDQISTTITRSLASYATIENLTLLGSLAIDGTGNESNNSILGNAAINTLSGGGGNDTLNGGADALADTLIGGAGNDVYVLNNGTDSIADTAGNDTITSIITRSLAATTTIENLKLLGTTALNGTGNNLANIITGNSAANLLDGGALNDTLNGGLGNDTYVLQSGSDVVIDTGGVDTITTTLTRSLATFTTIERLTLVSGNINGTGNTLNNTLTGSTGNNILDGGAGNDSLVGGAGADTLKGGGANDTLAGGTGNDVFVFNAALGASNRDTISDFSNAGQNDVMHLENTGAGLFTLLAAGALSAAAFKSNASGTATDANDRIIYNATTGALFYDTNGNVAGGATQFATLTIKPALTAADFIVI